MLLLVRVNIKPLVMDLEGLDLMGLKKTIFSLNLIKCLLNNSLCLLTVNISHAYSNVNREPELIESNL
jgi:hypothetical protein